VPPRAIKSHQTLVLLTHAELTVRSFREPVPGQIVGASPTASMLLTADYIISPAAAVHSPHQCTFAPKKLHDHGMCCSVTMPPQPIVMSRKAASELKYSVRMISVDSTYGIASALILE